MSGNQAKSFEVFKRLLLGFSDIKIVFKIIAKMKGKINLHTKGTLKDISKRQLYSYKTLIKSLQNQSNFGKKLNFIPDIPNLFRIHQLSLTHFGCFDTYLFCKFHFY